MLRIKHFVNKVANTVAKVTEDKVEINKTRVSLKKVSTDSLNKTCYNRDNSSSIGEVLSDTSELDSTLLSGAIVEGTTPATTFLTNRSEHTKEVNKSMVADTTRLTENLPVVGTVNEECSDFDPLSSLYYVSEADILKG